MNDKKELINTDEEELSKEQLNEMSDAAAQGIKAAHVRVLCVNGSINRAIIGYGKDCTNAYKDATNKAQAWCHKHGGTQKITKVKCQ